MGLLKHLLFWPVTGPLFLTRFSLGKVEDIVQEELTDDSQVKAELLELQLLLELGDIDDDEYVQREAALMQRLREIREWREQLGMGVSGGLVRVAAPGAAAEPSPPVTAKEQTDQEAPKVARPGDATIDLKLDWE